MEFFGFRALEFTGQGGRGGDGAAWITHHLSLVLAALGFRLESFSVLGIGGGGCDVKLCKALIGLNVNSHDLA